MTPAPTSSDPERRPKERPQPRLPDLPDEAAALLQSGVDHGAAAWHHHAPLHPFLLADGPFGVEARQFAETLAGELDNRSSVTEAFNEAATYGDETAALVVGHLKGSSHQGREPATLVLTVGVPGRRSWVFDQALQPPARRRSAAIIGAPAFVRRGDPTHGGSPIERARRLSHTAPERAVPIYRDAIATGPATERPIAAWELGTLLSHHAPGEAADVLTLALDAEDAGVRTEAALLRGRLLLMDNPTAARDALEIAMGSPDPEITSSAGALLADLLRDDGDEVDAIPYLRTAVTSEDPLVRDPAALQLGGLLVARGENGEGEAALRIALEAPNEQISGAAALALSYLIGDEREREVLLAQADACSDTHVAARAALELGKLEIRDPMTQDPAAALAHLGRAMRLGEEDVAGEAALHAGRLLAASNPVSADELLERAMKAADPDVAYPAGLLLADLVAERDADRAETLYRWVAESPDADIRVAAEAALDRAGQ